MAIFEETKSQIEEENFLQLMTRIEGNPLISQRALAAELGVALGLMNTYLKRCVTKGWVRARQVAPRRFAYFLTPDGFVEKSKMVANYLARSLTMFRDARSQFESAFNTCRENQWLKIAIVGKGDLTEIALLIAHGKGLSVKQITNENNLNSFDAVLITDMNDPQAVYDNLKARVKRDRLLCPDLLKISRRVND